MELYREFFRLMSELNKNGLDYAVVGGIALAFHDQPRFTRDIDILARSADLPAYERILKDLGYVRLGEPWTFKETNISLHRFGKRSSEEGEDPLVVDLSIGHEKRHEKIIRNSLADESPAGIVRLANRADLIWMKRIRGSKQDAADIERLEASDDKD